MSKQNKQSTRIDRAKVNNFYVDEIVKKNMKGGKK